MADGGGTYVAGGRPDAAPERAGGAIRILDEVVVRPGLAAAYRDAYHATYVPLARARGMTLLSSSRTPADIAGEPVTLLFLWSVPDAGAWWQARVRDTEAKARWWAAAADMTISRRRLTLSDFAPQDPPA